MKLSLNHVNIPFSNGIKNLYLTIGVRFKDVDSKNFLFFKTTLLLSTIPKCQDKKSSLWNISYL